MLGSMLGSYSLLILAVVMVMVLDVKAQQSYVNNHQLDCYNHYNTTDGFVCDNNNDNKKSSCPSFLTFRSISPYDSPVSISYLLHSDASLIAAANNISDVDLIPSNNLVLVPLNCSCTGHRFYQHNATYSLKTTSETYFSVANNTYQGLTTCQALMAQNPSIGDRNLSVRLSLQIPLRCACPSSNQTKLGVKYLLTYLVTWRDDISSISRRFAVDSQSLLDANMLSSHDIIYPFTPLLVPLTSDPSPIALNQAPPSPPPPQTSTTSDDKEAKSNSKKWVFVGIGIGVAVILLLGISTFIFCFLRRRAARPNGAEYKNNPNPMTVPVSTSSDRDYSSLPDSKSTWSVSSQGIQSAVESLALYDIEEVQRATDFFNQANKIQGSVYRGSFKGDDAAIKVMKGDVSSEINILKRINHSNVIRLSGFCVHQGNTYLVYEYAVNGTLNQCLQLQSHSTVLTWKQRVEIAHDVADALNYLHNFADPPYIHKNLKSSNILLDGNLRAKVSNFGLARRVENSEKEGLQLTRHVVGTHGYLAPEYIENGVITPKMDVFAFGVVILELLSGKEAATTNKNNNYNKEELLFDSITRVLQGDNVREKLREFIDPALRQNDCPLDLAFSMAQLANSCVARDLNSRPDIAQVFVTLSKIRSSTRNWDPSDELQNSKSLTHTR